MRKFDYFSLDTVQIGGNDVSVFMRAIWRVFTENVVLSQRGL